MARRSTPKDPPTPVTVPPKNYVSAEDLLKKPEPEAIRALADYDGPVKELLERIIMMSDAEFVPKAVLERWCRRAMAIMNVIYKVNGVKTSYLVPPEPVIPEN